MIDRDPPLHIVQEIGGLLSRMLTREEIHDYLQGCEVERAVDAAFHAVTEATTGILESVGQPTDSFWVAATIHWAWDLLEAA